MTKDEPTHFRAVFVSDLHLGTRGSQTRFFIDFLSSIRCDQLYLVGDIVDGWRMRKSWYWDASHDKVLRLILKHAKRGTDIVYLPGNHDEALRRWLPLNLQVAGIRLAGEASHTTATGKRLLVIHGDQFDSVVRYAKILAHLGDNAYTVALLLNRVFNAARRKLGYPYWSLSRWLKQQVKGAVTYIDRFEEVVARHAASRGFDGVVCGHIHHAQMREVDGILYANDGDWVESCTALVEHPDGRLELIDWAARRKLDFYESKAKTRAARPARTGQHAAAT